MKTKKYPNEIYVVWEPTTEDPFLNACESLHELAPDVGQKQTIAVYKLVKTMKVTTELKEIKR